MQTRTRSRLWLGAAVVLGAAALALAVLSFVLIKTGAYPPEGTGSLGHVGMVIAGLIAGTLALVFGALAAFCFRRRAPVR